MEGIAVLMFVLAYAVGVKHKMDLTPHIIQKAKALGASLPGLASTAPPGPIDFSPCDSCDMPCRRACPQKAFIHGPYSRDICTKQMNLDKANRVILEKAMKEDSPGVCIKYCRACELACPVGR